MSIRIGILGYGNLGRGVECAIKHNPDTELVAVFTRRDPETVKILTETAKVYSVKDAEKMKDEIDVLIICGGSATDLPDNGHSAHNWQPHVSACSPRPGKYLILRCHSRQNRHNFHSHFRKHCLHTHVLS